MRGETDIKLIFSGKNTEKICRESRSKIWKTGSARAELSPRENFAPPVVLTENLLNRREKFAGVWKD